MWWIDHFGLTVSDLDRSVEFYTVILDSPPMERVLWSGKDAEYVARFLDTPGLELEAAFFRFPQSNTVFEVIQYRGLDNEAVGLGPTTVGATHIGFFIESLEEGLDRIERAGATLLGPPTEIPYGPYKGGMTAYFQDPDGTNLQIMQVRSRPGALPLTVRSAPVDPYVQV